MKVFRIEHNGKPRVGVADDSGVGHLLDDSADALTALRDHTYTEHLRTTERVSLDRPLLPPIEAPSIRDFITFEQHTAGSLRSVTGSDQIPEVWFELPGFYFTNPHAAVGSGTPVAIPPGCELFDFECEVAVIIGQDGYNLSVEEAAASIAGFTILNDWSARDLQRNEMRLGLGPAKGKDSATTLGPFLTSVDELTDHFCDGFWDLTMETRLNGRLIGQDNLAQMAWSFAELIAYASRGTWVRAGDVIGSGTAGGGCLAEFWGWHGRIDPPPLMPGDEVEMTVDRLGTIRNTVVAGPPAHPIGKARPRQWQTPSSE